MRVASMVLVLSVLGTCAFAHEHKAPHGGTLIEFGEEFAHLELVLDANEGTLRAYVLDGEAEKPVRIAQPEIILQLKWSKLVQLNLKAVPSVLTGETVGDTSEFIVTSPVLKGLNKFDAMIISITIKGQKMKAVEFSFPKGNEGGKNENKPDHK